MAVHFTPEIETTLAHCAAKSRRNPAEVVQELISRYLVVSAILCKRLAGLIAFGYSVEEKPA